LTEYRIECVQTVANSAERRRRIGRVYALLCDIARRAGEEATADGGDPGQEAPSAASTSDASRCQYQFTPKPARAQAAEG